MIDEHLNYLFNKQVGPYDRVERFIYLSAFDDFSKMNKLVAKYRALELVAQWETNIRDINEFTMTRAACWYMRERVIPTLEGNLARKHVPKWILEMLFKQI